MTGVPTARKDFILQYEEEAVIQVDIEWLVRALKEAAESGIAHKPGETLLIGWVDLRVDEAEDDRLTLLEPDWTGLVPIRYVRSVTKALIHLRRQKDVADSLDLTNQLTFPNILESGVVCTKLGSRPCGVMDRLEPAGRDSGWFFGCDDPSHDHDNPSELRRESLYRIGCLAPGTIQFCALPAGLNVSLGGLEQVSVTLSGERVRIRPGSYLDQVRLAP